MSRPIGDVDEATARLWEVMEQICDVCYALPETGCVLVDAQTHPFAGRVRLAAPPYTRCRRRRNANAETTAEPLRESYRVARKTFQRAIRRAKATTWEKLIDTIDANP